MKKSNPADTELLFWVNMVNVVECEGRTPRLMRLSCAI